jgi:HPt (histidine-containing phosphotransfer) domain-containing protein
MTDARGAIDRELAALHKAYRARLPLQAGELDKIWQTVQEGGCGGEALAALHALAHGIAGSGATFGYPALSEAATPLEELADNILRAGAPPSDAQRDRLAQLVEILRSALSTLSSSGEPPP